MRTAFPLQSPARRPPSKVGPWVEIAAWLLAFAILLAAPCAPEPPGRSAARAADRRGAVGMASADVARAP